MKKTFLYTIITLTLLSCIPVQGYSSARIEPSAMGIPKPGESLKSDQLLARLNEIKAMDKSDLNFSEKRQLRKETRSIKHELKQINGGVYISATAIILIALLLIILL
jgi:hypothetical protein